jgi:alpha 1,3-glucosidase
VVAGDAQVTLSFSPFKLLVIVNGKQAISLNSRGLFDFEHSRVQEVWHSDPDWATRHSCFQRPRENEIACMMTVMCIGSSACRCAMRHALSSFPVCPLKEGVECDGCWSETFLQFTDSKPSGPEGMSLDISFPGFEHVYGLPERASSFALKPTSKTRGGEGRPVRARAGQGRVPCC